MEEPFTQSYLATYVNEDDPGAKGRPCHAVKLEDGRVVVKFSHHSVSMHRSLGVIYYVFDVSCVKISPHLGGVFQFDAGW